ncbi:uncharacterized protein LOC134829522 isoform X2 [Culicoides brevitarsis]|uniref:uncharacterized protein LOC134829522 isoform X2 n=1 Tax=Culicoides brevitarsis TaxID=469753 RepID=UPI00307BF39C
MDTVLSVLVTTISAMDIIEVLAYFAQHLRGDTLQKPEGPATLETLKTNIRDTIAVTPVPENSLLTCAQDGTLYKDQYRVDTDIDAAKLDEIDRRVDDLAKRVKNRESDDSGSNEKDNNNNEAKGNIEKNEIIDERTSDPNNNNLLTCDDFDKNNNVNAVVDENSAKNTEKEFLAGLTTPKIDVQESSQVLIETEKHAAIHDATTSLDSCYESLQSAVVAPAQTVAPSVIDSSRLRPLTREDEFRQTIKKRSSVSSTSSHESRIEELQVLSNLENEEQQKIDEYMPIIYPGSPLIDVLADCMEPDNDPELETIIEVHSSSPDEPQNDEETQAAAAKRYSLDKSPVPNIGVEMNLPWGDLKQDNKAREMLTLAKSASIEEVEQEDAAKETQKWVENLETEVIKEDDEEKSEVEEPVLTVVRKRSLKTGLELAEETTVTRESNETPEPVIIQKKINLIGLKPKSTDANNNEHDDHTSSEPPTARRRDARLEVDVDNQYMDDPKIQEMANYVKKLTNSEMTSISEDVDEEYYWKPNKPRRSSEAVATKTQDFLRNEAATMEYQEHWNENHLKMDEDVLNKRGSISPHSPRKSRSHSIAFESSKFAGHRRDSLAEMLIIPKTVKETCESSDHLLQQLENEALEYQLLWGIDVPKLKEQRRNRSQSISVAQLQRRRDTETGETERRRDSIAEMLIVPRSAPRNSIDEGVLLQLENEALAYQYAWNLNPEEVGNRRSKNRSMSISMGILSRKKSRAGRGSISRRRQSLAETFVVPKDHAGMVVDDPHLLSMLENEAYAYQQAFKIQDSDLIEQFDEEEEDEAEKNPDYKEWFQRFDDQTTSHIETSDFTDDEDAEVANLLDKNGDPQIQNHIFYSFPKGKTPPSKSATPDTVKRAPSRPTTPADYENYMHKFPDQLSPEIEMNDGRKSPASLETYIAQNRLSPIPSPRAITPEPTLAPPSMETYLERMKSASPQPETIPSIEIEAATPVIHPTTTTTTIREETAPRSLTPLRTMEHPPSLETYLAKMRSQSEETEY